MSNFFDKEDVKKIKILNDNFGMEHRYKPRDMNNKKDLWEYLQYKSCAFLDYLNYYAELNSLLERYDESLEHYDTVTWFDLSEEGEGDEMLREGYRALSQAESLFYELSNRAEKECAEALTIILQAKKHIQKHVLGAEYELEDEAIKEVIEAVFEGAYEMDYHYNMERAFEEFIKHVNAVIKLKLKV